MTVYLYGVTVPGVRPLPDVKGRQEAAVRLVSDDRLAVLVSDVHGEPHAGRKDLLAHAHVLEAYVEDNTVVPMQFGIALPDDDAVRQQVLEAQGEEIGDLLDAFHGLVQLTVQAFHDEEWALRQALERDPRLVEMRDQLQGLPEPAAQDGQVRLGQAVAAVLQDLEEQDADAVLERLAPLARAVAQNDAGAAHEVLNAAFLVERDARSAFDAAVGELREDVGSAMRIRYVGPQPPYAFLDAARNGELAWD